MHLFLLGMNIMLSHPLHLGQVPVLTISYCKQRLKVGRCLNLWIYDKPLGVGSMLCPPRRMIVVGSL